ncbi:hypothetical protein BKA61DRAFT_675083 [Leptodontidium sp. MPI-SDFR-AT-0119]|nr:hypothetical protein BKA61DRAFT_675083 [Leptodontidium sp. MPI-SDFR-AT-0119]
MASRSISMKTKFWLFGISSFFMVICIEDYEENIHSSASTTESPNFNHKALPHPETAKYAMADQESMHKQFELMSNSSYNISAQCLKLRSFNPADPQDLIAYEQIYSDPRNNFVGATDTPLLHGGGELIGFIDLNEPQADGISEVAGTIHWKYNDHPCYGREAFHALFDHAFRSLYRRQLYLETKATSTVFIDMMEFLGLAPPKLPGDEFLNLDPSGESLNFTFNAVTWEIAKREKNLPSLLRFRRPPVFK